MGRLFGTDGIRGIANQDLTCELATQLGRAAAQVLTNKSNRHPRVLIGKDTRLSSDMLENAMAAGLCSIGASVVTLGVVPTPAVAYLVEKYKADAGVMISASHNSFEYNGIKIFSGDGFKLPDDLEERIEDIILGKTDISGQLPVDEGLGTVTHADSAVRDYIEHVKSTVHFALDGMKLAIDCANGSASATAETLFTELGAEVTMLNQSPDGINVNDNCGSTRGGARLRRGLRLRRGRGPVPDGGRGRQFCGRGLYHGHLRPGHEEPGQAEQEHRGGHYHD